IATSPQSMRRAVIQGPPPRGSARILPIFPTLTIPRPERTQATAAGWPTDGLYGRRVLATDLAGNGGRCYDPPPCWASVPPQVPGAAGTMSRRSLWIRRRVVPGLAVLALGGWMVYK